VLLRNVDTGIETQTTSNDTGNYRFGNIAPGKYTLKIFASVLQRSRFLRSCWR